MKFLFIFFAFLPNAFADPQTWETASDIGLATMVISPVAYTVAKDGWKQGGVSAGVLLANAGINYGLKHLIQKPRPNLKDNLSMPSGHAQTSFCGATILCFKESKLCVPAFAVATTVAVGRVKSFNHFTEDVIVGGGIGILNGVVGMKLEVNF